MTNVIVRNVADTDVEVLKKAASSSGMSLQAYLAMELHNKATQLRRREALGRLRNRLNGRSKIGATEVVESMEKMRRERDLGLGTSE